MIILDLGDKSYSYYFPIPVVRDEGGHVKSDKRDNMMNGRGLRELIPWLRGVRTYI